ncbi:hypothetical protein ACS04_11630 [Streptomyces roseus]|uniref:Uncharacterized protein n=1 Tax=Streptomyces roseus TaxID=66430 RepID=A0A0J7AKK5_9ACTN|nr:hypothetical protein ACS04_11630 [Streptomyces roseus]
MSRSPTGAAVAVTVAAVVVAAVLVAVVVVVVVVWESIAMATPSRPGKARGEWELILLVAPPGSRQGE